MRRGAHAKGLFSASHSHAAAAESSADGAQGKSAFSKLFGRKHRGKDGKAAAEPDDDARPENETIWAALKRNLSAKAFVSFFLLSLLIVESVLTIVIIARVKYTEIDWKTYMTQVSLFVNGELDYANLHGPTGPVVYPAGFVYIYSALYLITGGGEYLFVAQLLFAWLYIATLFVVILIYRRSKIFPFWAIALLMFSRRNHSIYVLRLFNDPVAMFFMFCSILALTKRKYENASVFFSLALSVKMNILLFAPGYAWVYLRNTGIVRSMLNAGIVAAIQVALAAPFLYASPEAYVSRAFDFGRQFLHEWTVNWRFVPEDVFLMREFALALLVLHVIVLVVFAATVWRRHVPRHFHAPHQYFKFLDRFAQFFNELRDDIGIKYKRPEDAPDDVVSPDDTLLILFSSNLIGITFARSLHYQFYSWYFFTLPYLLWRTDLPLRAKLALFALIEFCWNIYPSTMASSGMLLLCHLILLVALIVGHPIRDGRKKIEKEASEVGSDSDKEKGKEKGKEKEKEKGKEKEKDKDKDKDKDKKKTD
ncbi:dolichyl-P-Man:Man(5)GlcNAc(2)-PP-dolichol alpha-1,3-mannosyltransferase [Polyrhizophydium stewartii]|uniref:Dol-P-Man:Man(5)GlcNAc(2)-PP-Dol alpha-1,3-mannosyltransferase n=1 Tax=Polyrhizophydium stewartii TaxID=2732419 RepID=A0ABR4N639_9FUNG